MIRAIHRKISKHPWLNFYHDTFLGNLYLKTWWFYHDILNLINYGTPDFPTDFNIELNTSCTRRCPFCPNSKYDRGLKKNEKLMDDNLFKKIIDELVFYNFKGRIGLHFYGEPLLHPYLEEEIRYIKSRLPYCRVNINTNGDLLTIEKYNKLVDAGIDKITVGQYDEEPLKHILELFEYLDANPNKKIDIKYAYFDVSKPHSNRGGDLDVDNLEPPRCKSPLNPMVIDAWGRVALCCNDYHTSTNLGDINVSTIMEVWNDPYYRQLRKELRRGIYKLPICKKCAGIA